MKKHERCRISGRSNPPVKYHYSYRVFFTYSVKRSWTSDNVHFLALRSLFCPSIQAEDQCQVGHKAIATKYIIADGQEGSYSYPSIFIARIINSLKWRWIVQWYLPGTRENTCFGQEVNSQCKDIQSCMSNQSNCATISLVYTKILYLNFKLSNQEA